MLKRLKRIFTLTYFFSNTVPGPVSDFDDRKVLVSWRADAQYFTVSTVEMRPNPWHKEDSSHPEMIEGRHLRVWNRDLELMSQCEALAGMLLGGIDLGWWCNNGK